MKGWLFAVLVVGAGLYYFVFRSKPGKHESAAAAAASNPLESALPPPAAEPVAGDDAAEARGAAAPEPSTVLAAASISREPASEPDAPETSAAMQVVAELERNAQAQPESAKAGLATALADKRVPPEARARLVALIDRVAKGDLERRRMLSQALESGSFPGDDQAYQRLVELNRLLIFTRDSPYPARIAYKVQPGDSLWRIVRRLQKEHPGLRLTSEFVQRTNELASDRLKPGLALSIPSEPVRIGVSKARFQLTLYLGDVILRRYAVCLGKDGKTPAGAFQINSRIQNPPWIKPGKGTIPFGDKENVLGTRWLGFQKSDQADGLGIHGTWEPETIGKSLSQGCVRLRNEDVEELFDLVPEGTAVTIE
ncbi:MAG: L,D-transpeptidase family protein [Planctomycetota bacterium]